MYQTTITRFFEAAHQLPDSEDLITKQCARLHGHTYHAVVTFDAEKNARGGMVVDFKAIKSLIDRLDHEFLNEVFSDLGVKEPTTAENIAKLIHTMIAERYPDLQDLIVYVAEGYKGKDHSAYVGYNGKN